MKRFAFLLVAVVLAVLALAAPAAAHVTVSSPDAVAGEEAVLVFHVPTESDTASTTKLAVQLPTDTPFASVSVLAQPGWTFTTKTTKLAQPVTTDDGDQVSDVISEVDWTATSAAAAIKPGEFGQFSVLAGPLPKQSTVRFGAVQTYSDGKVVRWNQVAAAGSKAVAEFPKPTLTLTASKQTSPAKPASTTGATVLSIVALVVAALALGYTVVGNARRKSG